MTVATLLPLELLLVLFSPELQQGLHMALQMALHTFMNASFCTGTSSHRIYWWVYSIQIALHTAEFHCELRINTLQGKIVQDHFAHRFQKLIFQIKYILESRRVLDREFYVHIQSVLK